MPDPTPCQGRPDTLHTGDLPTEDEVYARLDPEYRATLDLILDYENGDLGYDDILTLFARLIRTGQAWTLQGHYGRTAAAMIDQGFITRYGRIVHEQEVPA